MKAQKLNLSYSTSSSPGPAPSVLIPSPPSAEASPHSMEAFGTSTLPEGSDASSRRQRITMACQYCRHRKIRCCGGSPCRNCLRSQRECEYAPVPEEVNRATREKKAIAKASKTPSFPGSAGHPYYYMPSSSPYFTDTPVFEGPYVAGPGPHPSTLPQSRPMVGRPSDLAHRRTVSVPNLNVDLNPWMEGTPSAPQLQSPAMFESPQWMYNGGWSPAAAGMQMTPRSSPFPSVLDPPAPQLSVQTGAHNGSTPNLHNPYNIPHKVEEMPPLPATWSTPNLPTLHHMPTSSPLSSTYYTPYPTPTFQHGQSPYPPQPVFRSDTSVIDLNADSNSPTLAPELSNSMSNGKELVGLGIGMPAQNMDVFGPTTMLSDEYFAAQAGY